jgi:hypothetical protein
MSKAVKTIASIALPVIGTIIAPGIGTALGSSLSSAALGGIGGAIGGAAGGAVSGGGTKSILTGAALGGAGGYIASGGLGKAAGSTLAETTGNAALQGPTQGTGVIGKVTQTGIGSSLARGASSLTGAINPASLALTAGNILASGNQANAARDAAGIQANSVNQAIQNQNQATAPYREFGENAINEINTIQQDPAGYINNNPLYNSLADDAERRLLANQASKGKVGSGGTAAALQEQLLNIGNGLVSNQVNTLQNQVNTGANAATGNATNTSNLITQGGNAAAAGEIGSANAISSGYQNSINTLLALQSLNKTPSYQQVNV